MEGMLKSRNENADVADLLSQVRLMITAGGCADRIDAERWLMTWLDTPNGALGGIEPRRLLEQADNTSTIR